MYYNFDLDLCINKFIQKGRNKAQSLRRTRTLMKDWLNNERLKGNFIYFVTFTFDKEYTINNYKDWNRKQFTNYLRRDQIAKKFNFILYGDFGEKFGRFHLHGLISGNNSLNKHFDYFNKFGFTRIDSLKSDLSVSYVVKYSTKFIDNFSFRILRINNV